MRSVCVASKHVSAAVIVTPQGVLRCLVLINNSRKTGVGALHVHKQACLADLAAIAVRAMLRRVCVVSAIPLERLPPIHHTCQTVVMHASRVWDA